MSMASWLVFMRHGSARERALGVKLPRPNLQPDYEKQAHGFIDDLADRVFTQPMTASG
jgi:hypothetical protein